MQQNLNHIKMKLTPPLKKKESALSILPVFLISFQILPLLSPYCSISRCLVGSFFFVCFYKPQWSWKRSICNKVINVTQFTSKFVEIDWLCEHFWNKALCLSIIWKFNKHCFTSHGWKRSLSLICGTSLGKADVATAMCKAEKDTDGLSTWTFSGLDSLVAWGTPMLHLAQLF